MRGCTRRRRSLRKDTGSSTLEFALIVPVFAMLTFGAVSTGLAVTHRTAMSQASRETARYGATLDLSSGITSWLSSVKSAAMAAVGSDLDPNASGSYWCVAYVQPVVITGQQVTASISSTSPAGSTSPCFTDSRTDPHVQVELRRISPIDLGVASLPLTLDTKSISRFER